MPPRHVKLKRSPRDKKKWRVELEDGITVDFGQRGASDFTIHKDAARMLRYLSRHARKENLPKALQTMTSDARLNPKSPTFNSALYEKTVKSAMGTQSPKELWGEKQLADAVRKAGFWSRWLLWSMPSRSEAIKLLKSKFNIIVHEGSSQRAQAAAAA